MNDHENFAFEYIECRLVEACNASFGSPPPAVFACLSFHFFCCRVVFFMINIINNIICE